MSSTSLQSVDDKGYAFGKYDCAFVMQASAGSVIHLTSGEADVSVPSKTRIKNISLSSVGYYKLLSIKSINYILCHKDSNYLSYLTWS